MKRVFVALFFSLNLLHAMTRTVEVDDEDQDTEYVEEDVWYGPGFYYGIWFDNEGEYRTWRGNHRNYPSNRNYYHHDHPIHYQHGGGGHSGGGGHGGGKH